MAGFILCALWGVSMTNALLKENLHTSPLVSHPRGEHQAARLYSSDNRINIPGT
jgi:hypothetical protein